MSGQDIRERRVRTGGIELSVAERGDPDRPTIVLVHGYPDSKAVWSPVAERLADRFHVVAYDVRGHGRSTAPRPLRGGFTLEKLTDDFLAVADAVSPGRPVHLVGHDWGSVQSWEFVTVERAAARIASFTSLCGPSLDHAAHWFRARLSRPTPRGLSQVVEQGVRSWYVGFFHTPVLPELLVRGPVGSRWVARLERVEKVPDGDRPAGSLRRDALHGLWLYRDNIRARARRPRTDAVTGVPVQVITPTGDPFLSGHIHDDLERWAPRLTRRTLRARHWCPRSRPDQLSSWIADFVLEQEAAGAAGAADTAGVPGAGAAATAAAGTAGTAGTAGGLRGVLRTLRRGARPVRGTARGPVAEEAGSRKAVAARAAGRDRCAERFGGQLVLVTGAASGIGRATALAFAAAGARVVLVDRDAEGAAAAAGAARRAGAPAAWAEAVDVADAEAMEKLAERVAREYGVVDVLVNNAGIAVAGSFLDTGAEDWRRVIDVNLWGVVHGCRLFARQMADRGQGGHIVTIASAAGYQPSRILPAYSTSKAAVLMLSQCLRAELAGRGIGVTAVCPGIVRTNITATTRFTGVDAAEEQRLRDQVTRRYQMRGFPPEKVADAVLRAVLENRAVVPVTPEAHGLLALSRISPKAIRALARLTPPR
ncbi:SDR family oxidoreductase [Streptomyces clavuligerus]|uniref:SDR family oxidoreductase n=1 Tax=Streptomyces clavuligerus TaxID=1901 RepID=UPI00020D9308|nr:SDR family oxidoreductase [Streptomyces clavuligerus]WDN52825.1 SDR family oxidoreductase [Streptomyces clavuligerus]